MYIYIARRNIIYLYNNIPRLKHNNPLFVCNLIGNKIIFIEELHIDIFRTMCTIFRLPIDSNNLISVLDDR